MTAETNEITELDLGAYVDDQLDAGRRIEVEAYLSRHPGVAAQVMGDLRTRDELRLALAPTPARQSTATLEMARRLERGLARDRIVGGLRRVAALAVLIAVGWIAHAEYGALSVGSVVASTPPPAYVADALKAHETAQVRAAMRSQPAAPGTDLDEIRAATAIVTPTLPDDWRVVDVQVFPSTYGPSLEMAIDGGRLGELSLYAVRPGAFDVRPVTVAEASDAKAAHWQLGEVAYALIGRGDAEDLRRAATRLSDSLY